MLRANGLYFLALSLGGGYREMHWCGFYIMFAQEGGSYTITRSVTDISPSRLIGHILQIFTNRGYRRHKLARQFKNRTGGTYETTIWFKKNCGNV